MPEVTEPKRAYVLGRDSPCGPATMKNWLPPELGWPVLAIAREPSGYCCAGLAALAGFSSLIV